MKNLINELNNIAKEYKTEENEAKCSFLIFDYFNIVKQDSLTKDLIENLEKESNEKNLEYGLNLAALKASDIPVTEIDKNGKLKNNLWFYYLIIKGYCEMISIMKNCYEQNNFSPLADKLKGFNFNSDLKLDNKTVLRYGIKEGVGDFFIKFHDSIVSNLYIRYNLDKTNKDKNKVIDSNIPKIHFEFDKENKKGVLFLGKNQMPFLGDRALILDFFYRFSGIKNNFVTYNNFNKEMNLKMKSNVFRLNIEKINKRVHKKNSLIKQIIVKQDKDNINEINFYKFLE